jgi:hypothetical protein
MLETNTGRYYWFGASWLVGEELELQGIPMHQRKKYTFANLVSNEFNVECINLGQSGISNNLIPFFFSNIVNNINVNNDKIFFCLTSSCRMSMLDNDKTPLSILPSIQDNVRRPTEHPYWKEWYKYFDTPPQRVYNYECIVNLLYHWCKNIGVDFYFINVTEIENNSLIDTTTPEVWLLPKNQCVMEFILPVVDKDYGEMVFEDRSWLTDIQWNQQKQAIEQYIKPCFGHPNLIGHRYIADKLINILKLRSHDN